MPDSLLPVGASELEIATAKACAEELNDFPVPLRQLWNPDTCPVRLLPYLAWAFSVDRWDKDWTEQTKRDVIKASMFVHQHKGTRGAIRRAIEPLGYLLTFKEWWDINQTPGTFRVRLGIQETPLDEGRYCELMALIDEAKSTSRHLTGVDVEMETGFSVYCGVVNSVGNIITVYPYKPLLDPTQYPPFDVKAVFGYQLATATDAVKPVKGAVGYQLAAATDAVKPVKGAVGYQLATATDAVKPVKGAVGYQLATATNTVKPVKNIVGYLLITEA